VAWGVFALTGLCFIKSQSLQSSEEIQALMKAPLSKRLVCLLFLKETSVLLSRILAGGADIPSLWQPTTAGRGGAWEIGSTGLRY